MATINRTLYLILSIAVLWINPSSQQDNQQDQVCVRKVDMVFVLDGSNSIGQDDFDLMITTLSDSLSSLTFGPDESRVGAVLYSSDVEATIPLQDNRGILVAELQKLAYPDDMTATDKGIDEARRILDATPDRVDTPKVLMLITDGQPDDPTLTNRAAIVAASRGIDLWAVGVGPEVDQDALKDLVGRQTFFIDSYTDLPNKLQNATRQVCEDATIRSTFSATFPTTTPFVTSTTTTTTSSTTTPSSPSTSPISSSTTLSTTPFPATTSTTPTTTEMPGLEDLCPTSTSGSTVSYVAYPGDCSRVIQCYFNSNVNRVLAVTRQCPSGKFWDTATQTCADSWTVDCPYDKCQKSCDNEDDLVEQNGLLTYPMVGSSCGAYWACKDQRSTPMCCPDNHAYNPETGCELSVGCLCEKDKEYEAKQCKDGRSLCSNIPIWTTTSKYQISTSLNPAFEMPCIYGGGFNVHECECVDSGYDAISGCSPHINVSVPSCFSSGNPIMLPASDNKTADTVAYSFSFDLSKNNTSIWMKDRCNGKNKVNIWQDGNEIKAAVYTKDGLGKTLSVFVDTNAPEPAEVTFQYSAGMFTLSVSQGNNQHVAMEEASNKFCLTCDRKVTIEAPEDDCAVTQVQAYDCRPNLNLVYGL